MRVLANYYSRRILSIESIIVIFKCSSTNQIAIHIVILCYKIVINLWGFKLFSNIIRERHSTLIMPSFKPTHRNVFSNLIKSLCITRCKHCIQYKIVCKSSNINLRIIKELFPRLYKHVRRHFTFIHTINNAYKLRFTCNLSIYKNILILNIWSKM
nr:MAG TPA: hypothetical protein [Caudoviricetes sp.]